MSFKKTLTTSDRFWSKVERGGPSECCCNPAHLFVGSAADNSHDMVRKGRGVTLRGQAAPLAKLTWSLVREIRKRYAAERISHNQLAREYGVAQGTLSAILRGEAWTEGGMQIVDTRAKTIANARRGVELHNARLVEADIPVIRRLAKDGLSQRKIASRFHVSQHCIRGVLIRATWKHVPEAEE